MKSRRGRRPLWTGTSSRSLYATITVIVLSLTVAVPAQMLWFLQRLAGGHWNRPEAIVAVVSALLIESVCWLCAFLYAESVTTSPVKVFRATTFLFAAIAAGINYAHGSTTDPKVGVVYALASLMGVGAFELYMHRTRHVATGMSLDEIRLWALRWRRHPRVMLEVGKIRATHGLAIDRETAWRMAFLRKRGNPTIPVAVSSALVGRLVQPASSAPKHAQTEPAAEPAVPAEPSATSAEPASARGVDVIEHPVSWADATSAEDVIRNYWAEPNAELDTPASSARKRGTSSGKRRAEQPVTSAVPPVKRNSTSAPSGTAGVQFRPTNAELTGTGTAEARMLRYFTRAEAKGNSIDHLDRNYIADQFRVTTRSVRKAIATHQQRNPR